MPKFDDPKVVALLRQGFSMQQAATLLSPSPGPGSTSDGVATESELAANTATVWTPNTDYAAGQWVITPGGYLASAKSSFTSGGTYSPSNWNEFTPGAELAYAANETATTQALGTASADVTGCAISVPLSPRPIWVEGFCFFKVTTAPAAGGTGTVALVCLDDQAAPVTIGGAIEPFEGGSGTAGYITAFFRARIAPNTPARVYKLQANRGGSTFAALIANGNPGIAFRSYIAAYSG